MDKNKDSDPQSFSKHRIKETLPNIAIVCTGTSAAASAIPMASIGIEKKVIAVNHRDLTVEYDSMVKEYLPSTVYKKEEKKC